MTATPQQLQDLLQRSCAVWRASVGAAPTFQTVTAQPGYQYEAVGSSTPSLLRSPRRRGGEEREIFATTKEDLEHGIAGQMVCREKLTLVLTFKSLNITRSCHVFVFISVTIGVTPSGVEHRGTVRLKSVPMASARLSVRCGSEHSRATTVCNVVFLFIGAVRLTWVSALDIFFTMCVWN